MSDDSQIWYGFCTFWTDDWEQLDITPAPEDSAIHFGVPCCPECGSVGFEADADEWWEGVQMLEKIEPGYYKFLKDLKNTCRGGITLSDLWNERKKELAG